MALEAVENLTSGAKALSLLRWTRAWRPALPCRENERQKRRTGVSALHWGVDGV